VKASALLAGCQTLVHLSWVFLKVGFVFFGGGYLLIPILHRELVVGLRWLTQQEFVDGVALSQLTPGPVAILATFCGFRRAGVAGAVFATLFVFLPAFALMVILTRVYARFRELPTVQSVLQVFPPAIIGMLVAAAVDIGRPLLISPVPILVAIVSLVAMVRFNLSPVILIGLGALIGLLGGR